MFSGWTTTRSLAITVAICALVAVGEVGAQSPACGSTVSGSGLLQSINYPSNYVDSHSCSWTLQASPSGGLVYMQFQAFATESCCDHLRVYSENGALLYSFSGSSLPSSLTLGSIATVIFTTDGSVTYPGFSIAVSSVAPSPPAGVAAAPCGGVISGSTPTLLMSTNYPSNYLNSVSCTWTVLAAPMCTNISLQLLFLVTEQSCDFLRVYNGSQLVYSFSGTVPAQTLRLGREATVTFTTDGSVTSWGFMTLASSVGCTFPRTGRFFLAPALSSTASSVIQTVANASPARYMMECGTKCLLQSSGSCTQFAYDLVRGTCQLGSTVSSSPLPLDQWRKFTLA